MKMIKSFVGTQLVICFLFAQQDHDDDDNHGDLRVGKKISVVGTT